MPWHRDIDFVAARADATWDESGYDSALHENMAAVRQQNMPVIKKMDAALLDKQRKLIPSLSV